MSPSHQGGEVGVGCCKAVFPALQGGPHNATIGALAFQLREVRGRASEIRCEEQERHHLSSFCGVLW